MMAEHGKYEAAIDVIQNEITAIGGWGLPNAAIDADWKASEYQQSLERSLRILEKAPELVTWIVEGERDLQEGGSFQDYGELLNDLAELFGCKPVRFAHLVDEDA